MPRKLEFAVLWILAFLFFALFFAASRRNKLLAGGSGSREGRTYFLSPQMRRLRHSGSWPEEDSSKVPWRSPHALVDGLDGLKGQLDANRSTLSIVV